MKLILTADVENLGVPGDIVDVKSGYGRNFLLPRGYAILATRGAEKQIEGIKRARELREIRDFGHAVEVKAALEALDSVTITRSSQEEGKLFGSVTSRDLTEAIEAASGRRFDKRAVNVAEGHIKTVGIHDVKVKLHPDVEATVKVSVISE